MIINADGAPRQLTKRQQRLLYELKESSAQNITNRCKFRESERYYKSRVPAPDLSDLLDFNAPNSEEIVELTPKKIDESYSSIFGHGDVKLYAVKSLPGSN